MISTKQTVMVYGLFHLNTIAPFIVYEPFCCACLQDRSAIGVAALNVAGVTLAYVSTANGRASDDMQSYLVAYHATLSDVTSNCIYIIMYI